MKTALIKQLEAVGLTVTKLDDLMVLVAGDGYQSTIAKDDHTSVAAIVADRKAHAERVADTNEPVQPEEPAA